VRVADTGIGVPAEQLPYVFDLFTQTPRALDRSEGGLGIGLTVVKLLAELHGGSAGIASAGDARGTEVVLRLPLTAHAGLPEETGDAPPGPHRRRRVVIIEDNHDAAETLTGYLERVGHEVIVAHDGLAGLQAALHHRPDAVICDIGLPGLNGFDIARRLRAEGLDSCLLIAISGYGEVADRERALGAGFLHYLTKPADPVVVAGLVAGAGELADDGHAAPDRHEPAC